MRLRITILFLFFLPFVFLHSQGTKFDIKYLGVNNGLTSGNIRKIVQDNYGFLWIATQDGLFRYDSRSFISYNTQYQKQRQIGGPDVRELQVDYANKLIWLSTSYGGINAIDLLTGSVVKYIPQNINVRLQNNLIKTFFVYKNIALLGCEKGFFKLDISHNVLTPIPLPGGNLKEEVYVDIITELAQEHFLILCRNRGGFVFDLHEDKITQHIFIDQSKIIGSPLQFYNCSNNKSGNIVITSSLGPLFFIWKGNRLVIDTSNQVIEKLQVIEHSIIRRAVFDNAGRLWIAANNGLFRYGQNNITTIQNNDERNSYNNWLNSVYAICADSENNIWLGCQNGLAFLKNSVPAFISHSYSQSTKIGIDHSYYLFPVNDTIAYSTAQDGLYKINTKTNIITQLDKGITYDFIFTDPFERLFSSNDNGLFIIHENKKSVISEFYPEFKSFLKVRINSAIKINDSCLALGTENSNGILIWNYKSKKVRNVTTKSKGMNLPENIINNLYLFDKNKILILSDASLSLLDYEKNFIKKIPLENKKKKEFYTIFFDACRIKDTLFIACYGQGILKVNRNFEIVGELTVANGLSNNGIYKLLPWKDSLLFITTNNGLITYNPHNGKIKQFFKEDGLNDNAFEETSGNIFNDQIFAGGTNGFSIISPEKITLNANAPLLYLSNVIIEKSNKNLYDTTNLFLEKIQIPNDVLQVTVRFPCISYQSPERVTFQYRINELQKNWINLNTQNFINLIGFSPGSYHLQVQAFNEDGVPSEIKKLTLIFLPKWYQTWLFKVLIVLAIASIFYGLYKFRINQLRKEEKIRKQVAGDLHDELGSTLNSVKIFANLALLEKENTTHLEKIKESTQSAISGVKDIIWVLDDKRDSLDHLLGRINQFARPICKAAGISYKQQSGGNENYKLGKEEKRNLYMIIKESINNSIKYSDCTLIELLIKNNGGKLNISISDNGKGFDKDKIASGYGLNNIMHRSKEIEYHAEINSSPGNGTLIYLEKK